MPKLVPPLYLLCAIALLFGLRTVVPQGELINREADFVAGLLAIIGGAGLAVASARLFRRYHTEIRPFKESSSLIQEGPYRWSRNPIYLGLTAIVAGGALMLHIPLMLPVAVPLFTWIIQKQVIRHEERMLEERFGDEYRRYRAAVRRWL